MKRIEKLPSKYRREITQELERLARVIQAKREDSDYTQEELAEELDISITTLKSIEQRIRFPGLPMLFYICRTLNIPIKIG